jgi:predicted ribosomally synthesized peptide with nif11-like leader
MSCENAESFFRKVSSDSELAERIKAENAPSRIIEIAAGEGYDFSLQELVEFKRDRLVAAWGNIEEPTNEQLIAVASAFRFASIYGENPCTNATPITCIKFPETFADDTCNCTIFQPGCP